jgi:transposase
VGIDAHADHCTVCCVSREGRYVRELGVPTSGPALRGAVKGLPRPVWAAVEAGAMAPFVVYALEKSVDRVIANETRENRWISRNPAKGDKADARRQGRQLRMNEYKEVHVPRRSSQGVRQLALQLRKVSGDVTRYKNRIKAKFRERGVPMSGRGIYVPEKRKTWLNKLGRREVRFIVSTWYGLLDVAAEGKGEVLKRLCALLRNRKEFKLLKGIPGIGSTNAATMIAVIDTPWRFPEKRKLYKYAGLGIRRPWTGTPDKAYDRPDKAGNRLLKNAAMTAAKTAVKGRNQFADHYRRMLAGGISRAMALKTIARRILATALAIWKSGIPYQDGS